MCSGLAVAALMVVQPGAVGAGEPDEEDDREVVVVTAEPAPPPRASTTTLDRTAIEAAGARSAQRLLDSAPGIELSQHGSEGKAAQFFVRGFDAAHGTDVTIGVGDLVFNEPSHIHGHGYADVGPVVPEAVDRVLVRKGAFALDQGNLSTAGDVSFQLGVPPGRRGTAAGVELGSGPRARLFGYIAPRGGEREDVVAGEVVADAGIFDNRHTRRGGLLAQHTLGDWRIRGAVQAARFGLPGAVALETLNTGELQRGDTHTPDTDGASGQGWLGVVHEPDVSGRAHRTSVDVRGRQFDANENFTGYLVDEQRGDERREFQRGVAATLNHHSRWMLSDTLDAMVYAGGTVDRFRQFEDAVDPDGVAYERRRGGQGWQGGLHLGPGLSWFIGPSLELEAGVRFEAMGFDFREDPDIGGQHDRRVLATGAPRASVYWFLLPGWIAFAATGRGFRGPRAGVFADESPGFDAGDTTPQPGHPQMTVVDGGEIGVLFQPAAEVEFSATVFDHRSQAEYVYDHVARRNVDLGATRRVGGELKARAQPNDRLRLTAHITGVDARFDDGRPIPFVPRAEAGGSALAWFGAGWFGGVSARGIAQRRLPFGARAAGFALVDAHAGWENDGWRVELRADNLLDTEWNEGIYHYASRFDDDQPGTPLPSTHVVPGHPRMLQLSVSHRW